MNTKLVLECEKSVTALVTVQNTGRISVVDCLTALGVSPEDWTSTYLQVNIMLVPRVDQERVL